MSAFQTLTGSAKDLSSTVRGGTVVALPATFPQIVNGSVLAAGAISATIDNVSGAFTLPLLKGADVSVVATDLEGNTFFTTRLVVTQDDTLSISAYFQPAAPVIYPPAVGVPSGGTVDQVLAKKSGVDYDLEWQNQEGGVGGSANITSDFTVMGVSQGTYTDGNVVSAGTSIETVVKNMLQVVIPPTYTLPTLVLDGTGSGTAEVGTLITPVTITPTFSQHDAGALTNLVMKKYTITIRSGMSLAPITDDDIFLSDTAVTYYCTCTYAQGSIKLDNMGTPSPAGRIPAGSLTSNTVAYTGKRKVFYAADTGTSAPTTSALVRALAGSLLAPVNGTVFTISVPAGTTRIVFAYPNTLQAVTSVKYVELGNGEVKDTFTLTSVTVAGQNGYYSTAYKVYTYIPAIPFGDSATYTVTI